MKIQAAGSSKCWNHLPMTHSITIHNILHIIQFIMWFITWDFGLSWQSICILQFPRA